MGIKVQKLSDSVYPFVGISYVNTLFNQSGQCRCNDRELGMRVQTTSYQYSEIIKNFSNVFISGGDCIEDISINLKDHLNPFPTIRYQDQVPYYEASKSFQKIIHHSHLL